MARCIHKICPNNKKLKSGATSTKQALLFLKQANFQLSTLPLFKCDLSIMIVIRYKVRINFVEATLYKASKNYITGIHICLQSFVFLFVFFPALMV